MRVTFARSRRGDKRIQFDSAEKGLEVHLAASTFQRRKHRTDAKHVGNVGNVTGLEGLEGLESLESLWTIPRMTLNIPSFNRFPLN